MCVEQRGQYAPYSVDLAVVLVDLADQEEDREGCDREGEGGNYGIGRQVSGIERRCQRVVIVQCGINVSAPDNVEPTGASTLQYP